MSKKVVILYSGGLDSFVMLKLARSKGIEPILVHYDIGQEYSEKELNAIKYSKENVQIRKVDWILSASDLKGKEGNACGNIMIPGRNMTLACLAASAFLPDEIWMGGLKGEDHENATDKNGIFVQKMNDVFAYVMSPYNPIPKLVFPLVQEMWGKFEAVKWVYESGNATVEEILHTSSCLSSEEGCCGKCIVCCRRNYIFKQLGFSEKYNSDVLKEANNIKMIIEMLNTKDSDIKPHYDKWRRQEILPGLYLEFNTNDHLELIKILEGKLNEL